MHWSATRSMAAAATMCWSAVPVPPAAYPLPGQPPAGSEPPLNPALAEALAQEEAADEKQRTDEVVVYGRGEQKNSLATGLDLSPRETPQSISVITREQMVDQAAANIADVQRGATETGSASAQVLSAAQTLSVDSGRLKTEVGKFLNSVRAA